jgi:hypothetical protein
VRTRITVYSSWQAAPWAHDRRGGDRKRQLRRDRRRGLIVGHARPELPLGVRALRSALPAWKAECARFGQCFCVAEHVAAVDLATEWDPNSPAARLTATDDGETRLRLQAHPDDQDQRPVDLVWNGCLVARMEPPNDEAISGHRLYDVGLREVLWLGEVYESDLIAELERRNRVHPQHSAGRYTALRHWVAPLKERTVEVVARSLRVERGGSA